MDSRRCSRNPSRRDSTSAECGSDDQIGLAKEKTLRPKMQSSYLWGSKQVVNYQNDSRNTVPNLVSKPGHGKEIRELSSNVS